MHFLSADTTGWLKKALLLIAIALIPLSITLGPLPAAAQEAGLLRLVALDVGEGQAILLQRNHRGVLVDTGHAGAAAGLLQRLDALGVTQLDYLILTHLHPDHASGYFRLREAFPRVQVLDHGHHPQSLEVPDTMRWLAEALEADPLRLVLRAPGQLEWQGVKLRALWPAEPHGRNLNADSLVLEMAQGPRRALLMGDVGQTVEQRLLEQGALRGPYDVLVAGHHASPNTAGAAFLSEVRPGYSIISTNAENLRGYPDAETVKRLRAHTRAAVLTTFDNGEVCLQWPAGMGAPERCP